MGSCRNDEFEFETMNLLCVNCSPVIPVAAFRVFYLMSFHLIQVVVRISDTLVTLLPMPTLLLTKL